MRFLFLILFIIPFPGLAQTDSVLVETDITARWMGYNPDTKTMDEIKSNELLRSVRMQLLREATARSTLKIISPDNPLVLLNGEAYRMIQDTLRLRMDSLWATTQSNAVDIVLYNKEGIRTRLLEASIQGFEVRHASEPTITSREVDPFINNFVIASILLLFYVAFLANKFPKDSFDYAQVYRSFSFLNREETLVSSRPLGRNNLLFISAYSLIVGFMLATLTDLAPRFFAFQGLFPQSLLLDWLLFSVVIFALIVFKYFLIAAFTALFALGEFRNIQFFNGIRFGLGLSMVLVVILIVSYLTTRSADSTIYPIIIRTAIILLSVRILVLFFKLSNYSRHKIFHLIIYLCATEIIPFLLTYKIVLG